MIFILRPATVCGYSPRLRLDLTVNILTNHAVTNRRIKVFGGTQMRPNIHIDDMVEAYVQSLRWPGEAIDGKIYNVGYENYRLMDIAEMVASRGARRGHRHHAHRRFAVLPRVVGQDPPRTGLFRPGIRSRMRYGTW